MRPITTLAVGVLILGAAIAVPGGVQAAGDADCREEARNELWAHGTVTVTETQDGETTAYALPSAQGLHAYLQAVEDCPAATATQ